MILPVWFILCIDRVLDLCVSSRMCLDLRAWLMMILVPKRLFHRLIVANCTRVRNIGYRQDLLAPKTIVKMNVIMIYNLGKI